MSSATSEGEFWSPQPVQDYHDYLQRGLNRQIMEMDSLTKKIDVHGEQCEVTAIRRIDRKTTPWFAYGTYKGEPIEGQGNTPQRAWDHWKSKAKYSARPNPIKPSHSIRSATREEVFDLFWRATNSLYRGIMPMLFDQDRLATCEECLVADVNGETVGAVTLAFNGPNGPTLDAMYVLPQHQGRGIGSGLCLAAMRRFNETGKTPVYCEVNSKAMHVTLDRLPDDLKPLLRLNLAYQKYGDLELPPTDSDE